MSPHQRLDVSRTLPDTSPAEIAGVLTAISRQPRAAWRQHFEMLGLDGIPARKSDSTQKRYSGGKQ